MSELSIAVCLASDENYFTGLRAAVVSLLKSNPNLRCCFHIIDGGISARNRKILMKDVAESLMESTVVFHEFDGEMFKGCLKLHNSYLTYARLLLPDLVKADKLLYLDSDILVTGSIEEMVSTDLTGKFVACCPDVEINSLSEDSEILGKSRDDQYFNAGVLLVNLKMWREAGVQSKLIKALKNNPERYTRHDQTAMNWFFNGNVHFLSSKYNCDSRTYSYENDTAIIHYIAGNKPWSVTYHNDASWVWHKFARTFMFSRSRYYKELVFNKLFLRSIKDRMVYSSIFLRFAQVFYIKLKYKFLGVESREIAKGRLKNIEMMTSKRNANGFPNLSALNLKFKTIYFLREEKS